MKTLLLILTFFIAGSSFSQVDTVIHEPNYTSYFSYQLHEPLYVVYKLYHGGGNCSRAGDRFKTDGLPNSATPADYKGNGFDEGHLANSKDFAYDCALQEATFRFFNCVPQSPSLNRGIWKQYETTVRKESQDDSLLIICGSIFGDKKIGPDSIAVPDYCWKIVYSLTDNHLVHCLIFPNDNSNSVESIDVEELEKKLGYEIIF